MKVNGIFLGGCYDPFKDKAPWDTALREAQEEGGFKLEPSDLHPTLVGQSFYPNDQFAPAINQTWAYFIDGVSQKSLSPPPNEIKHAEWVDISEIMISEEGLKSLAISKKIKAFLATAISGFGFQKILNTTFEIVHAH